MGHGFRLLTIDSLQELIVRFHGGVVTLLQPSSKEVVVEIFLQEICVGYFGFIGPFRTCELPPPNLGRHCVNFEVVL